MLLTKLSSLYPLMKNAIKFISIDEERHQVDGILAVFTPQYH